ncbi:MAG: acyl-CoA synthetase [Nocardia sp.]|uniref:acyl-CoA synthetase n=1 Tax=Nocardia sp. TaxID=1821 RepID=UPI0026259A5D|nr:acyl-CoA synthetase [Nocardia sp.]MCU1642542.1 acyl-CoA synthetase [Nocardia sp.]
MSPLFPALATAGSAPALRFGDRALNYAELESAATALAARIAGAGRVMLWATPTAESAVAVIGALLAGIPVVPVNPKSGERELAHIVGDSSPDLILAASGVPLPAPLSALPRVDIDIDAGHPEVRRFTEPDPETPALIIYTSGTTGPPKGVVLPRRAIRASLDGLAQAWQWTAADVLVHALPLFHVHGLVLGILGPLRRGGSVRHLGTFDVDGVARELRCGATMFFGVPTMYHRLADAVAQRPELAEALAGARLLVSGSAALAPRDYAAISAATGRTIIERYGMTETLMNTSVRLDAAPRPGTVGVPLPGVDVRLAEEDGRVIAGHDGRTVGEIQVRGANLFTEYLGRPDATAAAFDGDWFRTGDMGTLDADGTLRIVGRKSTDLIKSGGYKIGAGEIENVLLEHPGVAEAAVTGAPDNDLGERIVAWVVPVDPVHPPRTAELADHVARRLAPHKRPRTVHLLNSLPRNDMGKVVKTALRA